MTADQIKQTESVSIPESFSNASLQTNNDVNSPLCIKKLLDDRERGKELVPQGIAIQGSETDLG